jgi:hypothetical protein
VRTFLVASIGIVCAGGLLAQRLAPEPAISQHVTVTSGASAPAVAPGGTTSLWADITPGPNIHVYAPGAKDFQAVALIVSPLAGVAFGKAAYPAGTLVSFPGLDARVPVYQKLFRITQTLTLGRTRTAGATLTIAGAVNYQACDDRVCFPPASVPVNWTVRVR